MSKQAKVNVGGRRINYLQEGSGEPLVFLHGWTISQEFYEEMFRKFSDAGFEVIAPNMAGIGNLRATSVLDHAKIANDFCDHLKLERYHLVGYSVGGTTALHLASGSTSPLEVVSQSPLLPVEFGFSGYVGRAMRIAGNQIFGIGRRGSKKGLSTSLKVGIGSVVQFLPHALQRIREVNNFASYSSEGLNVRQPTKIIHAENDEFYKRPVSEIQELFRERISNLELQVLPEKTHVWPIFFPELAARLTLSFIQRNRKI